MADIVDKKTRSRMMSSVRSKNTKPEWELRRRLFASGFRYRLHAKDLPGKPDMVFPKYRAIIFVHGCFWHYHGCRRSSIPETRRSWWKKKLEDNVQRDSKAIRDLLELGWRVLVLWECGFRKPKPNRADSLDKMAGQAANFLRSEQVFLEIPELNGGRNAIQTEKGGPGENRDV